MFSSRNILILHFYSDFLSYFCLIFSPRLRFKHISIEYISIACEFHWNAGKIDIYRGRVIVAKWRQVHGCTAVMESLSLWYGHGMDATMEIWCGALHWCSGPLDKSHPGKRSWTWKERNLQNVISHSIKNAGALLFFKNIENVFV